VNKPPVTPPDAPDAAPVREALLGAAPAQALREGQTERTERDITFFRQPPPEGRSRESTIVLDARGSFLHDGVEIAHKRLASAMHTWIQRHPDDGRYILCNGYDWSYFEVLDVPFFVRALSVDTDTVWLCLSDETREPLQPADTFAHPSGALYTEVKRAKSAPGKPYWAKFTRSAQMALAPFLVDVDGEPGLKLPSNQGLAVVVGHRSGFR
jgi:uncharacterized protein